MAYHILLANDDGIMAEGIYEMCAALCKHGFAVTVAAPMSERSGAGHGITIHKPLRAEKRDFYDEVLAYAIDGTPADCVKLGVKTLVKQPVDLVISGINNGGNLGKDTHYSGTVSAAMEGIFCGIPAMAVSIGAKQNINYAYTAEIGAQFAKWLIENPFPEGTMLNINVPNLPKDDIKGMRWAALSSVAYEDDYEQRDDPNGRPYYWIRGSYRGECPADADLDFMNRGYITLTPVTWDMTNHAVFEKMKTLHVENLFSKA